jgi:hypothetical protein
MFTLAEPHKGRYRLIIEPKDLKDCWKSNGFPHTDLPQIADVKNVVLSADKISAADLKCEYYQLSLNPEFEIFTESILQVRPKGLQKVSKKGSKTI